MPENKRNKQNTKNKMENLSSNISIITFNEKKLFQFPKGRKWILISFVIILSKNFIMK